MKREIQISNRDQISIDYADSMNYLLWGVGVLLFLGVTLAGEHALINGAVFLAVMYLITKH